MREQSFCGRVLNYLPPNISFAETSSDAAVTLPSKDFSP